MTPSAQSLVQLVREPIDFQSLVNIVTRSHCGAVLLFLGTTREWTDSNQTHYLQYEAYEDMALAEMRKLAEACLQRWPIGFVGIIHRLGRVEIGQASIAIAVSTPHREEAYQASQWLIDSLKELVPIWKKDYQSSGSETWIHSNILKVKAKSPMQDQVNSEGFAVKLRNPSQPSHPQLETKSTSEEP